MQFQHLRMCHGLDDTQLTHIGTPRPTRRKHAQSVLDGAGVSRGVAAHIFVAAQRTHHFDKLVRSF